MGSWGSDPFANDDAADFLGELEEQGGTGLAKRLGRCLKEVAGGDEYLEVDEGNRAIAAAALIAYGRPGVPTVEPLPELLLAGPVKVSPATEALAVKALDRVLGEESEWRALRQESKMWGEASGWVAALKAALTR